jgi:tRNA A37 threonylcarbamoyladenosine synthetase subunit TsaC/SUA5/YrdC
LPTTSANVSGRPELGDAAAILAALGDGLEMILDAGPARGGVPSTVVDASGLAARILRPGAIDETRLDAVLAAAGLAGLASPES